MIQKDQPTCFDDFAVRVAVSSVPDGQMQGELNKLGEKNQAMLKNRKKFLAKNGITPEEMALLKVRYSQTASYTVIKEVHESAQAQVQLADCLITTSPHVALFLPIADCVGTVVYDPVRNVLALAHLGRHSSIAKLAKSLVQNLKANYNSKPSDLIVWMPPSIQLPNYVLEHADFVKNDPEWSGFYTKTSKGYQIDLQGYNKKLFISQGVLAESIHISSVNTATNSEYWSHFTETTIHAKKSPPRFAVVAVLK